MVNITMVMMLMIMLMVVVVSVVELVITAVVVVVSDMVTNEMDASIYEYYFDNTIILVRVVSNKILF